uniref:phage tail sheath family protein n=1 Tax=uncultured Sphingomonas sp. TaxID=158754 RepID=UPI0035CAD72E
MLARPDTPGVYIQSVDADRGVVAGVRTDIAGFVGIADRGPIGVAVACRSMRQFESIFGSYIGGGYLAYAVRAFFENGGRDCRVVRVAAVEASVATARIRLADGRFGLTLTASTPGSWGNTLSVRIMPSRRADTIAPGGGTTLATPVVAIAAFTRLALVRITQGGTMLWRIAAAVDASTATIYWVDPDPALRRDWQQPLSGIDTSRPFRVERIDHDVAVREAGRLIAVDSALSPIFGADRFAPDILRLPPALVGTVNDTSLLDAHPFAPPPVVAAIADGTTADWASVAIATGDGSSLSLSGGIDGLIHLAASDFIDTGLAPLARAKDVAILACPDILIQPERVLLDPLTPAATDPCAPCAILDVPAAPAPTRDAELPPVFDLGAIETVQAAMIAQCEALRDRVALIDSPFTAARSGDLGPAPVQAWRQRFDSAFGILYFPWVAVADPLVGGGVRLVPPSGHVAGQFARTDRSIGVHRAAAGEPLDWAQAASATLDPPTHGLLNTMGINALVARDGRPLRILGARTMASDPDWRFVPVRRLVCMIRDALDLSTQWAVFEPNSDSTRLLMTSGVTIFLTALWQVGALAGTTPAEAFRVRCDTGNNDADARANGLLIVDIAIAPSVPLEFIILRIGRQGNSFELVDDGSGQRPLVGGLN